MQTCLKAALAPMYYMYREQQKWKRGNKLYSLVAFDNAKSDSALSLTLCKADFAVSLTLQFLRPHQCWADATFFSSRQRDMRHFFHL